MIGAMTGWRSGTPAPGRPTRRRRRPSPSSRTRSSPASEPHAHSTSTTQQPASQDEVSRPLLPRLWRTFPGARWPLPHGRSGRGPGPATGHAPQQRIATRHRAPHDTRGSRPMSETLAPGTPETAGAPAGPPRGPRRARGGGLLRRASTALAVLLTLLVTLGRLGPTMTSPAHVPVLLDRVVALLAPALERPGSVLVDATLGLGGHTEAVLTRCPQARVVGIDRDPQALERGRRAAGGVRRAAHPRARGVRRDRRRPRRARPRAASTASSSTSASPACSSTSRDRGFAYAEDAPSTCGWTTRPGPTAADVLNTYPAAELTRILREYGEERFAPRIAERDRPRARAASRSPTSGAAGRAAPRPRSPPPPGVPADTRPSAPSRRCASRSTTSSAVLRRALPAAIDAIGVGGRVVVDVLPLARGPDGQAGVRRATRLDVPPDLPFVPEEHQPILRLRHPRRREGRRRRDRREPPGAVGAAARRRARPTRMSAHPRPTLHPARAARDHHEGPAAESAGGSQASRAWPRPPSSGPG